MKHSSIVTFLLIIVLSLNLSGQEIKRPALWGIARMTFLVSDFENARSYYSDFLGFRECFTYSSDSGEVVCFKVNDRQFLEFVEDRNAKEKPRMVSVSFETENVEQMRLYLKLKGIRVPESVRSDGAGNEVISVFDPSGNKIEFLGFRSGSLHILSSGKFLSEERISKRIHHVGLYADKVRDNDPFYAGILEFKEMWRYPDDKELDPDFLYLVIPECSENIELLHSGGINTNHPCLLVDDMQETIYTLKERKVNEVLNSPVIGKGNRWLLNIMDPDNNKVEFTEAHTVR